jgi:hypothetical protein
VPETGLLGSEGGATSSVVPTPIGAWALSALAIGYSFLRSNSNHRLLVGNHVPGKRSTFLAETSEACNANNVFTCLPWITQLKGVEAQ